MISIVLRVVRLAIALLVLRGELAGVAPEDLPDRRGAQSRPWGGVGVFEAIVVALLTVHGEWGAASRPMVAALVTSLLVYRVIYYLLPLCGAVALSGIAEMIRSRRHLVRQDTAALRDVRVDLTAADAI